MYISMDCKTRCQCNRDDSGQMCNPLCPKLEYGTDNYNNKPNCTVYEAVEKTSCKCLVMKTSCKGLKGNPFEKHNFFYFMLLSILFIELNGYG